MEYGYGAGAPFWIPFLCGALLAGLLGLLPLIGLMALWLRSELRRTIEQLERWEAWMDRQEDIP